MKLFEIKNGAKPYAYVPNSQREQFDDVMLNVEPNAKEYEDIALMKKEHPQAQEIMRIWTNPSQDHRGMVDLDKEFFRDLSIDTGKIHTKRSTPPEFTVWQDRQSGMLFIEDLLNEPSMVIQMSPFMFHKLQRSLMFASSPNELQRLIATDE
jgi:hypothetical protein